ncbi:MaoC family dehydratase N-terminal domain-containing protein [Nocardia fusca]|uniref:FAS1-like dehydratase domain-containing protein n=1 Tax=Nocardia fusca TaxID=941183 RepID=UPI0037B13205
MPDPDFGKITDAKLAELRRRIGIDLDADNFLPVDPEVAASWRPEYFGFNHSVTADGVRHFVNGYGDDNPLYCDEDYGAASRWKTLIAPPTFLWTMFTPHDDIRLGGGDEPPRRLKPEIAAGMEGDPIRGTGALQSDLQYEFYRPLRLGDRMYAKRALVGAADKRSSWGGRAVHATWGLVSWNQDKEIVCVQRGTWIRAERKPVEDTGTDGGTGKRKIQPGPEPYTDEQLAEIDAAYDAEQRRGAAPRYWEDVEQGDELPVLVKGPLRITDAILWHAGFGQAFPTHSFGLARRTRRESPGLYTKNTLNVWDIVQRMHWDPDWAHKVGAAACYDYGALRETFIAQALGNWAGDDAWLWKLNVQHRRFNYVGDTTWIRGRVTGKEQRGSHREVHVEVWCENQRGEVTSPGTAVLLLPSRKDGLPEIPAPPAATPLDVLRGEVERLAKAEES